MAFKIQGSRFKFALRQLCLLTFCSRCTPPKALFDLLVKGTSLQMRYWKWLVYVPAWPTQRNTTNAAFSPPRPPRPSIWESSHTSLEIPGNDKRCKKKCKQSAGYLVCSFPSLPMPAHLVLMNSLQSLRSDDELLQKFLHPSYSVLRETTTLSFSSLVLSPLSFSMWEWPMSGIPSGSSITLAHSADDTYQW